MADLFHTEDVPQMVCWDRKNYFSFEDQVHVLKDSKTVYVGNLSFFTTEVQLNETFSIVGPIKRIIMGLNSRTKTPCGFCFIEYFTREHAAACLKFVSGTVCDDRIIRSDLDSGFKPGRQYGRGQSGGQIRDERRANYDPARGGPCTQSQSMLQGGLSSKRSREPSYQKSSYSSSSTIKTHGSESVATATVGASTESSTEDIVTSEAVEGNEEAEREQQPAVPEDDDSPVKRSRKSSE